MAIKVKVSRKNFGVLGGLLPDGRNRFAKEMKRNIEGIILEEYNKGTSPVKGGKFNPYKKLKNGDKSRVKDSGDLHRTLRASVKGSRRLINISIGKGLKYARFLQDGTDKMVARPLLPEGINQKFKKGVLDKIIALAKKAVAQAVKKVS